jgi:F0F1-type ATP synthase epsilon subunit
MPERLRWVIRTPHGVVLDQAVEAVRVPTESGQVGLRPREETLALVVEPGLVVFRSGAALRFAATAGGLLEGDRETATLYTPFAVAGDRGEEVLSALDRALATPDSELQARSRFGRLEQRIVQELRQRPDAARPEREA